MSWPGWTATAAAGLPAGMAAPVQSTLMQTAINSAPSVIPPGLQYSPEQWAQAQQQNWQQWAQWQQQYQQWHQQYGAEYQKSMSAIQGTMTVPQPQPPLPGMPNTGVPPPLPAENKPPPPPDDPPANQPTMMSSYTVPSKVAQQAGYTSAAAHTAQLYDPYAAQRQNWQMAQVNANNKRPYVQGAEYDNAKRPLLERPNQWANQKPNLTNQWQTPQAQSQQSVAAYHTQLPAQATPAKVAPNIEELSEAEKKFDKEFAAWEAQFNKWKDQNANHPDKTQYLEYEKKWESWRNSLLERREQMRRKRLAMVAAATGTKPNYAQATPPAQPAPNLAAQPPAHHPQAQQPPRQAPEAAKPLIADSLAVKPPPNLNNEPLAFKPPTGCDLPAEEPLENAGEGFLKSSSMSGGIPGLDLVKEDEAKLAEKEDVIDLEEEKNKVQSQEPPPAPKGPDLDAISKGINNILGDQKLLSMLSIVSQNPPAAPPPVATDTTSNMNPLVPHNFNAPPPPPHQFGDSNYNVPPPSVNTPYNDHSNHSLEDRPYGDNYPPREAVNNFDDQTRSSFTMGPNDQDPSYQQGNAYARNQLSRFPTNRLGQDATGRGNYGSGGSFAANALDNRSKFGPVLNRGGDFGYQGNDNYQESGNFTQGASLRRGNDPIRGNATNLNDNFSRGNNYDNFNRSDNFYGDKFGAQDNFNRQGNAYRGGFDNRGTGNFNSSLRSSYGRSDSYNQQEDYNDKYGSGGNYDQSQIEDYENYEEEDDYEKYHNMFNDDDEDDDDTAYQSSNQRPGMMNERTGSRFNQSGPASRSMDQGFRSMNQGPQMRGLNQGPQMKGMGQGPQMKGMGQGPQMRGMNQGLQLRGNDQGPQMRGKDQGLQRGMDQGPTITGMGLGKGLDHGPQIRGMDQPPPMRGMNQPPPMRGMDQPPPMRGMDQPPPMRGMDQPPPMRGMDQPPPMRGMDQPPPMRGGIDDELAMRDMDQGPPPPLLEEPIIEIPIVPQETDEIFEPVTVVDYDHKSQRVPEPEVVVEPVNMFDYRHKPLNRIPLPQRPPWLSESVKFIREFDPALSRPLHFERPPPERYPINKHRPDWEPDMPKDRYNKPYDRDYEYNKERNGRFSDDFDRDREPNRDRRPFNRNESRFERPEEEDRGRRSFSRENDRFARRSNEEESRRVRGHNNFEELSDEDMNDFETDEMKKHKEGRLERSRSRSKSPILSNPPNPAQISEITMMEDILNPPGRFNRPPRIVIILRGPPGSGKTYLAKIIKDKEMENGGSAPRILSLDDYFMVEHEKEVVEDGKVVKVKEMVYEYEAEMEESYRTSFTKFFKKTITDGYFPFIVVDNVNDKVKYFGEMWSFAKQNGFQVYICQMDLDPVACSKRNIHNRSVAEIEECIAGWEPTPSHHPTIDASGLLQAAPISEVEMEEEQPAQKPKEEAAKAEEGPEDEVRSKWDTFDCSSNNLAKLDGVNKPLKPSRTMEEYLQLEDDWTDAKPSKPGQKRVRWADLEEQRQQKKMRAIGFVVGHTNWDRMMDPTDGGSALTQTKYFDRGGHY